MLGAAKYPLGANVCESVMREGYIYSDSRCYSMVLVNWPSRRARAASEPQGIDRSGEP